MKNLNFGKRKTTQKGISIRWKLATYMSLFVAVVLLITWLSQIVFLDTFYRSVKKREMRESAEKMVVALNTKGLESVAYGEAIERSLCVLIFHINGEEVTRVINADATGGNVIMMLSPDGLRHFYNKAMNQGGSCFSRITFGGVEIENSPFWENLPFQNPDADRGKIPIKNVRLLYVQVVQVSEQESYLILLDSKLQPLDTTVRTLTTQYIWIAGITLAIAAVAVLLLYRKISAPLIRMNESAKQLAQGKYDVVFSGSGYLETRELADTLNYASHELSKVDRLQKELIANISHDLRTPLTMIKGYGEVMRDLPGENTPENMQVIIDETTRLSELVNDLLDLSRIQAGAREPSREAFNLTIATREILQRYDTLNKHRGYHIDLIADEDAFVYADRQMILQVLYNLINNALNYTGDDKQVTVRIQTIDATVRVSVTDTGDGIAPDQIPLIWDRYYKVDKVHRRAMIGTGLGLSIVKEILEKHSADYGVDSIKGSGSTFWFELLHHKEYQERTGDIDL